MARRSQWLTARSSLSNWLTDTESEAKAKVSLSKSTETFSSSPLFMGLGDVIGLQVFGFNPIVLSESPESSIEGEERFTAHPLLSEEAPGGIGLEVFGDTVEENSVAPISAFLDIEQVRDHWHNQRSQFSDWRTRRMNEEMEPVSLEFQPLPSSTHPLLFDAAPFVIGLTPFGINLFGKSTLQLHVDEILLDVLATEDLNPICTEDGDEIGLG